MWNINLWMPVKSFFPQLLLALLPLAGVADANLSTPVNGMSASFPLQAYKFVSGDGKVILLDTEKLAIVIGDRKSRLQDCSDGDYYCYKSLTNDLGVAFPRACSISETPKWVFRDVDVTTISMFPHANLAAKISSGHPSFMFEYQLGAGLVGLWFDPDGALFGSDRKWSRLPFDQLRRFHYTLMNAKLAFPCSGSVD